MVLNPQALLLQAAKAVLNGETPLIAYVAAMTGPISAAYTAAVTIATTTTAAAAAAAATTATTTVTIAIYAVSTAFAIATTTVAPLPTPVAVAVRQGHVQGNLHRVLQPGPQQ